MAQSFRTRWRLPTEHGAWGMLYIPMLLGFLAGRTWTWNILALFVAATGCFLGRGPMLAWARAIRWQKPVGDTRKLTLIYLGAGGSAGLYLLFVREMWFLAPMAGLAGIILGLNTWQGLVREDRTISGEISAILGMTLTGPAAFYATSDRFDWQLAVLWLLCVLYFTSSVVYVKMRVLAAHEKLPGSAERARRICFAYHTVLLAGLSLAVLLRLLPFTPGLGFLPIIGRAFWFAVMPTRQLELKRIGWSEVVYSLIFLTAAGIAGF